MARSVALPFTLNVVAAATFTLQRAAGSARLAQAAGATSGADRFPLLFSCNQLVASGVATAVGSTGAAMGWGANGFYACVSIMALTLVLASPCLALRPDEHWHLEDEDGEQPQQETVTATVAGTVRRDTSEFVAPRLAEEGRDSAHAHIVREDDE